MRFRTLITAIAVALLPVLPAIAQPFGIAAGTPLSELQVVTDLGKGYYIVTPPRAHSDFEQFIVMATPKHGVCSVGGVGKSFDNEAYGISLRAAMSEITKQLESTYGKGKLIDFLRSGAMWSGAQYWATAIKEKQRVYQIEWASTTTNPLSNRIKWIRLDATSIRHESTYMILNFTFNNIDECQKEQRDIAARAF